MNKVNAETEQMIARADAGGRKAGEAAGVLGEGLGGMWDQGHGIGTGFLWQEEDYSFFLELLFGNWDVAKGDQQLPSKFIAGGFAYVAYDIIGDSPTEGAPLDKGDDEFTRMIIGLNVLNNSLGVSQFRFVLGPTANIVDVYGPTGKRVDNMKVKLGFDVGIAGATDGYMTAFTYNLQSEVMGLHFVFKK